MSCVTQLHTPLRARGYMLIYVNMRECVLWRNICVFILLMLSNCAERCIFMLK